MTVFEDTCELWQNALEPDGVVAIDFEDTEHHA
ncbi:hypothetical protein SAMN04489841_1437 [Natrinema salaciae]|uniref:Uncharacterized protein n=1 Tax=Natrinema salaciae TaxID=1186196 RepID=A0A1H9F127_9EURY|nr:hypothetical protein SAMN04489841_1437 [Natrinema salaciae]